MIVDDIVSVRVASPTVKHWNQRGYPCNCGDIIKVSVKDLMPKSCAVVLCRCDACGNEYKQRFSRNTDVCYPCRKKIQMKGNVLGSKNLIHPVPPKDELLHLLETCHLGKQGIAHKYGVSIPTVNRWLDEYSIEVPKYKGLRHFKTNEEETTAIQRIEKEVSENPHIFYSEISKNTGIPVHMIKRLESQGKLKCDIAGFFGISKIHRQSILNNIEYYQKQNETKDIKTIAMENDISYVVLKSVLADSGIPIKLHTYNKSRGELECKEYIQSIVGIDECFSKKFAKDYEIDCFVPTLSFGVEYCGEFWHKYSPKQNNKYYHRDKFRHFKDKGIHVMMIFEHEWYGKNDIVKSLILSRLGKCVRIPARKCYVKEIPRSLSREFHQRNHLSGSANSSIDIGLYFEDALISVLSIIKSRFDKQYEYEISRYSTRLNHTVVGGLSKMFSYFVRTYSPKSCMTYADLRLGEGKCYEKIGFTHLGSTPPNYYYFNNHMGKTIGFESRIKYQKHKLKEMQSYDASLTEFEIMDKEGYFRIYDCGNNKYGLSFSTPTSAETRNPQIDTETIESRIQHPPQAHPCQNLESRQGGL